MRSMRRIRFYAPPIPRRAGEGKYALPKDPMRCRSLVRAADRDNVPAILRTRCRSFYALSKESTRCLPIVCAGEGSYALPKDRYAAAGYYALPKESTRWRSFATPPTDRRAADRSARRSFRWPAHGLSGLFLKAQSPDCAGARLRERRDLSSLNMPDSIMLLRIMLFVNRQEELARLDRVAASEEGGLVVVYGRRRVGKTRLLLEELEGHDDRDRRGSPAPPAKPWLEAIKPA
jgi:hypothetical protein